MTDWLLDSLIYQAANSWLLGGGGGGGGGGEGRGGEGGRGRGSLPKQSENVDMSLQDGQNSRQGGIEDNPR